MLLLEQRLGLPGNRPGLGFQGTKKPQAVDLLSVQVALVALNDSPRFLETVPNVQYEKYRRAEHPDGSHLEVG